MKLELEVKTNEEAERLIKELQGFIEENKLYPNIEKGVYHYIDNRGDFRMGDKKDVATEYLANIYVTREVVEKALEFKKSRKVWNFIENWAMHNSTFESDWEDEEQAKYYVWYDSETSMWDMYYTYTTNIGIVYMLEEEYGDYLLNVISTGEFADYINDRYKGKIKIHEVSSYTFELKL